MKAVIKRALAGLLICFFALSPALAAVAVDATGSADVLSGTGVTSVNYSNLTIGTGNALVVTLTFDGNGAAAVSAVSCSWDNLGTPQAMTQLGTKAGTTHTFDTVYLFGLRAPTAGNKQLHCSWTGSSQVLVDAISFTGVNQTSDGAAFSNFLGAESVGTTNTVTITSATGNYVVGVHLLDGTAISSVSATQLYIDNSGANDCGAANYTTGAATVAMTMNGSNGQQVSAGISVNASTGGGPTCGFAPALHAGC